METVIDPVEYAEHLEFNRDIQMATGKKWKNCHFPSIELLKSWTGHGYLVWSNEGKFDSKGNFQFFENSKDYEPLLCDLNSARLVVQMTEASPVAAEMFETKAMKERCWFLSLAKVCWKHAKFGN